MTSLATFVRRVFVFILILMAAIIAFNYYTFRQTAVGGAAYQDIILTKNLRIDTDPAQLYVAGQYAQFVELESKVLARDLYSLRRDREYFKELHFSFNSTAQYWLTRNFEDPQIGILLRQMIDAARDFYYLIDDFFDHLEDPRQLAARYQDTKERLRPFFQSNLLATQALNDQLSNFERESISAAEKAVGERYVATTIIVALLLGLILLSLYLLMMRQADEIEKRREHAEAIAQELGLLNQQLEDKSHQLELLNTELESFSYSVAHDLRAPLRTLNGFSKMLVEDYREALPEEARDYLNRIAKSAIKMGAIIDDILNLSRVSRESLNRGAIDLAELVRDVIAEHQREEKLANFEFLVEEVPEVSADPKLMKIALENLVNNAIKYAGKKTSPQVRFGYDQAQECFFVEDNGCGFDMNYAQRLFGVFQRLHSAKDYPGTGIGLATVSRVISKHGGKIWAQAEVDKGARFSFKI